MKTAIISPIPCLKQYATQGDGYHLILASLVQKSREYRDFYADRRQQGDFVILDNDAHESGVGQSANSLVALVHDLHPSEIVLPDRLFMGDDTIENSKATMNLLLRECGNDMPRTMGVPQGRTFEEWFDCARDLLKLGVDTIGISKDYEVWPGSLPMLIKVVGSLVYTYAAHMPIQIHMLGWARNLQSLYSVATTDFDTTSIQLRGVDSAKPLVYARAGVRLDLANPILPSYPQRPHDFFTSDGIYHDLAMENIHAFQQYAHATPNHV